MGPFRLLPLLAALALGAAAPPEPRVQPPPFMDGLFPCTGCHDGRTRPTDPRRRVLEDMHENIVLDHLGRDRWCFDCHDPARRDALHLKDGAEVPFTASWRLCAQCHPARVEAWREGRHGRAPGATGPLEPLPLCVACHNPHAPRLRSSRAGAARP